MKNTYILKLFFAGNSRGNVKGNREEVVTKNFSRKLTDVYLNKRIRKLKKKKKKIK